MFSANTKDELARFSAESRCCVLAELAAIARMTGRFAGGRQDRGDSRFEMTTENAALARRIVSLVRDLFGLRPPVNTVKRKGGAPGHLHVVSLPLDERTCAALDEMGVVLRRTCRDGRCAMRPGVPWRILARMCCRRAYLRGAFLARGYVQDPEHAYHMEIMTDAQSHAKGIVRLAASFAVAARISGRRRGVMVYVKGGDDVAQLLRVIGAHASVIALESVRVVRGMRGNVNRAVNCDTANVEKAVEAGLAQMEAIRELAARVGLHHLPPGLQEIARLRLEHPGASLKELGEMAVPAITKSAANHRMRRLLNLARRLRAEDRGDSSPGANTLVGKGGVTRSERGNEDGL
ncbi:MAG: DNA-binding protein WhiA [Firmicutes bacterium]|jgi:DNA-binding protein WhiA|nr:DNA-binding protein WhiA [Bacillota bacterium]